MAFLRAAAFRSAIRSARPTIARQCQPLGQAARRGYAAQSHAAKTSDAPWAIGAVLVTVPTCWFLLQSAPAEAHHPHTPGHHGSAHEEEKDHVEDAKTEKVEEKPEEKEEKEEAPAEADDETPSDSSSKDEVTEAAAASGEEDSKSEDSEKVENSDQEKEVPSKKDADGPESLEATKTKTKA